MKRFASDRVTGLMERLGLEEDVAIESRLVSKTIESAQSRVEGYNFDIRKRVVEFDDVINKQRETIYAERDKVLKNEDLTDTVRAFLDEEIDALVDGHLAGEDPDAWDVEGLSTALTAMGLGGEATSADTLWDQGGREAVGEYLREIADERLAAREAEVGEEHWAVAERIVLLRTIDSLWVEHLTEVDDMRRGIGLRGYAQQDPLNEFRREAYRMYEELRDLIRHGVASAIFRVTIQSGATARRRPNPAGSGPAAAARWHERRVDAQHRRACRRLPGRVRPSQAGRLRPGRRSSMSASRAVTRRWSAGMAPGRRAVSARGTRRPGRASAATIRAGVVPGPSTRSATAADRLRHPCAPSLDSSSRV